jgi:hypothetical protein
MISGDRHHLGIEIALGAARIGVAVPSRRRGPQTRNAPDRIAVRTVGQITARGAGLASRCRRRGLDRQVPKFLSLKNPPSGTGLTNSRSQPNLHAEVRARGRAIFFRQADTGGLNSYRGSDDDLTARAGNKQRRW